MASSTAYADREALEQARPICAEDDRYIAEELEPTDIVEMRTGCDLCPIRFACAAYARAEKPRAGFWAGEMYPRRGRPSKDAA